MILSKAQRTEYDKLLDLTTDVKGSKLSGATRSIFTEWTTGVDGTYLLISSASFKCRVEEIVMYSLSTGCAVTLYINKVPVGGATDIQCNGGKILSTVTDNNIINVGDVIELGMKHTDFAQEWLLIKAKIVLL